MLLLQEDSQAENGVVIERACNYAIEKPVIVGMVAKMQARAPLPDTSLHWSEVVKMDEIDSKLAFTSNIEAKKARIDIPSRKIGAECQYDPIYCDMVYEDMCAGYSLSAFGATIGASRRVLLDWERIFPEFRNAVDCAKSGRLRTVETSLIDVIKTGGSGSQGTVAMFMAKNANRDEWKDKQDVEHSGQLSLAALVETSLHSIKTIEHSDT